MAKKKRKPLGRPIVRSDAEYALMATTSLDRVEALLNDTRAWLADYAAGLPRAADLWETQPEDLE